MFGVCGCAADVVRLRSSCVTACEQRNAELVLFESVCILENTVLVLHSEKMILRLFRKVSYAEQLRNVHIVKILSILSVTSGVCLVWDTF